jgi:hypothetical protein
MDGQTVQAVVQIGSSLEHLLDAALFSKESR